MKNILNIYILLLFFLSIVSCASSEDSSSTSSSTSTETTSSSEDTSTSETTTSSSDENFIAVGSSGTIISSPDGITWTSRSSGTTDYLSGSAYGNSTFVVVGNNGTILTSSDDATSWTSRTSGTTEHLYRVTFGDSTFVAVGNNGTILSSSDGITWTSKTSGTSNILWAVKHVNKTFLTVGDNGTILTSSDNGTSWTSRTTGTTKDLWEVTYGNNNFITVGDNGTILSSSDNGSSWDNKTSGTTNPLWGVTYGNGIFVVVGPSGNIYTTSDGDSLTSGTSGISNSMWGITFGGSTFVTASYGGEILTSSDNGTSWTSRTSGTTNELSGLANNHLLSAPDNLTATKGWNTVTLDWDSVAGVSSYTLYWDNSTDISSSSNSITSIANDYYTHSGLDNATTYYYKVAAINSTGTGTLSSEVNARTEGISSSQTIVGGTIQGEEISLSGKVTTFAGPPAGTTTSGDTDNATSSEARFSLPIGSSSDGTSFYIAEYGNHKIRKINISSGAVTTLAGPPAGTTSSGDTDNATASNARFNNPYGITTDGTNLYVSDTSNNKIRKIVIDNGTVTTLAGPPAGTTTAGDTDNATSSNARFNSPAGIVIVDGNLYVADWQGNKIRKVVISSGAVTTFAGPPAGTTTSGDTDNDTASNARFKNPFGMTTDGINLFVSDVGNNKIRKIVISSGAVTTIAGPPAGTTTSGDTDNDTASNARFNTPYGISSDGTYIYVGDFGNNKVRRIE